MDYELILEKIQNDNKSHVKIKNKILQLICCGFGFEYINMQCSIANYEEYLPINEFTKYVSFILNELIEEKDISSIESILEKTYNIKFPKNSLFIYLQQLGLISDSNYFSSNDMVWKMYFMQFKDEIDFKNIYLMDIYENTKFGKKLHKIKKEYKKASKDKKEAMRDFWDLFPDEIWDKKHNSDKEWKELFITYYNEFGFENLNQKTIYKDKKIGNKLNVIKTLYFKSTPEQQKELKDFWDCFPDDFWNRLRKEKKENEKWKDLFIDYNNEFGFEVLNQKTIYKGENIGNKLNVIKTLYFKSTPEQQKELKDFWDCFPESFWERKTPEYKTDEEWKDLFIQYDKEIGIDNLKHSTKFNNENIGNTFGSIKTEYNNSTLEQQKSLKKYWNCFPESLWDRKISKPKSDEEWKELFVQYDKEIGIENLKHSTKFNNENIGIKFTISIKGKYYKSTEYEQKQMRDFWDCFPESFWERRTSEFKTEEEWKALFIQYDKEIGIENLLVRTIYENQNLGVKYRSLKVMYCNSTPDKQKKMKKFWGCFPDDFWDKKTSEPKSDEEWRALFIQYNKEIGIKKLNSNSKFKNKNIGYKIFGLKEKYSNSTPDEQKEMREFWDFFPDDFWGKRQKTEEEWKALFVQYDKEFGIDNLMVRTIYKNENLGSKYKKVKERYHKSTPEQQKEMRESWDCFPESIWGA